MHAVTSLLYMLQRDEQKPPIDRLSRSETPKTQQVEHWQHPKKPEILFVTVNRGGTLAPTNALLS